MQEVPNTFATAFAHVTYELLHHDMEPILNALRKDRPAALKKVAKNLANFGTGTEGRNRPLLRRDWEELLEQSTCVQYHPIFDEELTRVSSNDFDPLWNSPTLPDVGHDPRSRQTQFQQNLQPQPMNIE